MNKQRKNNIKTEIDTLRALRKSMRSEPMTKDALVFQFETSKLRITAIYAEEQNEYENMSEKQQCSEKGEIAEESMALLEDAMDYMDEIVEIVKSDDDLDLSELGYNMEDVIDLLNDILSM